MCKKCGKKIMEDYVLRNSTCSFCGADLHSCINCNFYSPGSHYDCHETVEELVTDKERANFCDSFSVNKNIGINGAGSSMDKAAAAKAAFNALFGA